MFKMQSDMYMMDHDIKSYIFAMYAARLVFPQALQTQDEDWSLSASLQEVF